MSTRNESGLGTRDVVMIALFAAIIVTLGLVPPVSIGVVPVPITLQTLGVMLAGAALGPVRGALSCALVALLTLIGLPVLSGGRGGVGVFLGPTGGYVVGWILGALVTGLLVKHWVLRLRGRGAQIAGYITACVVGGILVVYLIGIPWLWLASGLTLGKAFVGGLVFVPGDLVKAVVAGLVVHGVRRAYPIPVK
ncbi:biotin transporter BioY [Actinosynnema sp. NPDC020468]|uniref:biotin transporter BioY n=1 Tax=Actinosynnema sp. NPDC020468 TaxID=3154488 RepID=UPI0033CF7CDE